MHIFAEGSIAVAKLDADISRFAAVPSDVERDAEKTGPMEDRIAAFPDQRALGHIHPDVGLCILSDT